MTQQQADVAYFSHSQAWRQMTQAVGGRCVDFDGVCVAMTGIPAPDWNPGLVVAPSVDPSAAIAWGVEVRRSAGVPGGGYDLAQARYPGLVPVFEELGHRVLVTRPMMVLTVDDLVTAPAPADFRVHAVADERGLDDFRDVQVRGFDMRAEVSTAATPWATVELAETAYLVGYVGDEPVTSALGIAAGGAMAVFGVTTVPEHRGRGYGRAVTAAVVDAAARLGVDLAWLQASAMGEPLYREMGFRAVEDYTVWAGADG
jgi:GNAT superfamily N-acetyltransferase